MIIADIEKMVTEFIGDSNDSVFVASSCACNNASRMYWYVPDKIISENDKEIAS